MYAFLPSQKNTSPYNNIKIPPFSRYIKPKNIFNMEKNSTLNYLEAFTGKEKKEMETLGLIPGNSAQPSLSVIKNILNYSKALKIRKTKSGDYLEFVLN